jgi:hypothetical protein
MFRLPHVALGFSFPAHQHPIDHSLSGGTDALKNCFTLDHLCALTVLKYTHEKHST